MRNKAFRKMGGKVHPIIGEEEVQTAGVKSEQK